MDAVLSQLYRNIRPMDMVDIAIVALILYFLLVWFSQAASRRSLAGLLVLMAVYFAARFFDLYLTALILHAGFAIRLILLGVVFQDDFRRILEREEVQFSIEQPAIIDKQRRSIVIRDLRNA